MKIIPVLLIVAGLAAWRYPKRRAFDRRNQFGVEEFKSYGHMRRSRSFERLMSLAGVILILVGIGRMLVPDASTASLASLHKHHKDGASR
jgi:hypothetical protein